MAEGWIILGVFVGSLGTLATAYATQRWTRQAAVANERRLTRVDERRRAVAPTRDFLDRAARASARRFGEEAAAAAYDANIEGIQQIGTKERVVDILTSDVEEGPSEYELTRELIVAIANAPTVDLVRQVFAVHVWALQTGKESTARLRLAINGARRLVEDYIVGGLEDATNSTDD